MLQCSNYVNFVLRSNIMKKITLFSAKQENFLNMAIRFDLITEIINSHFFFVLLKHNIVGNTVCNIRGYKNFKGAEIIKKQLEYLYRTTEHAGS